MIEVESKVKYSSAWLRSTGQYTGDICFAKGKVTAIKKLGTDLQIATIEWDKPDLPERVNVKNLTKVK